LLLICLLNLLLFLLLLIFFQYNHTFIQAIYSIWSSLFLHYPIKYDLYPVFDLNPHFLIIEYQFCFYDFLSLILILLYISHIIALYLYYLSYLSFQHLIFPLINLLANFLILTLILLLINVFLSFIIFPLVFIFDSNDLILPFLNFSFSNRDPQLVWNSAIVFALLVILLNFLSLIIASYINLIN